jgi:hypothetical protein
MLNLKYLKKEHKKEQRVPFNKTSTLSLFAMVIDIKFKHCFSIFASFQITTETHMMLD